ncbi:MAG: shikimate kinase [Lachnospiraceae bacterium]|nr:shikimate kinase [Lachnospiraceae bacterium]
MQSLILEGFMGSGKTYIGRKLSARLELPFIDTDLEIERRQQTAIADIFSSCGEEAFRQMETSMLGGLMLEDTKAVISLGGGAPVREANRRCIRSMGQVFYLKAPVDILLQRLRREKEGRPMLKGDDLESTIERLLKAREGLYMSLADHVIDVSTEDADMVCDSIMEAYVG